MCRWLAYSGLPIAPAALLFKPKNSLIRQSLSAARAMTPTNGDGFGLGWYGDLPEPGVYRDMMPAWNDANLRSIAEQIRSKLFFAHVRASTGTPTTRLNCHPFAVQRWAFMHNGKIGGYGAVRRDLEATLPGELYARREGSTDSELFFLLLMAHDIDRDPLGAFGRTVKDVLAAMEENRVDEPFRMTAACSDGHTLYAVRYSSDGQSPSLYWRQGANLRVVDGSVQLDKGADCTLVLSEPLDEVEGEWREIPEGTLMRVVANEVLFENFRPKAA